MPKKIVSHNHNEELEEDLKEDTSKYDLKFKTVQSDAIKTLVETLKETLKEATFTFDKNGAKLVAMDNTRVALIHLRLNASEFQQYYCKKKKILVSLNLHILFKLMKFVEKDSCLTFYIEKDNRDVLSMEIRNRLKNTRTIVKINLLDMENDQIEIPEAEFSSIIVMPSQEFHKVCKDISNVSDYIEIKSVGENLIFSCDGDSAKLETTFGKAPDGIEFSSESDQIIQGIFSLKYLLAFTKATSLHSSVRIYIKNNWPMILEYQVASLGTLKFCLSPKVNE